LSDAAVVQVRGSWRFIDKAGRLVIGPKYEWCCGFSEGVAVVMKSNEVLLIDESCPSPKPHPPLVSITWENRI
jgi:hypothetical protein